MTAVGSLLLRVSGSAADQTTLDEMNPFLSLLKQHAPRALERLREREREGGKRREGVSRGGGE